MHPDSLLLVVLLFMLAVAGIAVIAWRRHLAVTIGVGLATVVAACLGGMAVVNDFYGYYQSWGQLSADLTGSYQSFGNQQIAQRIDHSDGAGEVLSVDLPGARSGINRPGLVYLPPQYFEAAYAHTTFPVVELFHGTPGTPSDWTVHLRVQQFAEQLLTAHQLGPMILVMPSISAGSDFQECVDAPGALDDTYLTDDVRADVLAHFRATSDPAEWGLAGYSSGGYCAANLALRHPGEFGAAAVLDGYFRPTDGPAAAALHDDPAAEAANDPLLAAAKLTTSDAPLPSFWVSVGTGDKADLAAATAFTDALHGIEQVTLNSEPGAEHNFYAWAPAVPRALAWLWTQLADPGLRVRFPISGPVSGQSFQPAVGDHAGRHSRGPQHARAVVTARTDHQVPASTHP